jgi:hypothetical protein
MPPDDGVWLDIGDGAQHERKQPIEPDEDQSVDDRQSRLRGHLPAQHVQLMPQHDDLGPSRAWVLNG